MQLLAQAKEQGVELVGPNGHDAQWPACSGGGADDGGELFSVAAFAGSDGVMSVGGSGSLSLWNTAPARTKATSRPWPRPAARDPGPFVTFVLKRTVAKVLSIGFAVLK